MKLIKIAAGIIIGGVVGFIIYKVIGCHTGSCPLTSNPWLSTINGAIFGLLIALN